MKDNGQIDIWIKYRGIPIIFIFVSLLLFLVGLGIISGSLNEPPSLLKYLIPIVLFFLGLFFLLKGIHLIYPKKNLKLPIKIIFLIVILSLGCFLIFSLIPERKWICIFYIIIVTIYFLFESRLKKFFYKSF